MTTRILAAVTLIRGVAAPAVGMDRIRPSKDGTHFDREGTTDRVVI